MESRHIIVFRERTNGMLNFLSHNKAFVPKIAMLPVPFGQARIMHKSRRENVPDRTTPTIAIGSIIGFGPPTIRRDIGSVDYVVFGISQGNQF
jgi:hypothetical protein